MAATTVNATIMFEEASTVVPACVDGDALLMSDADIARATGWQLRPEGLCRDSRCLPTRAHPLLLVNDAVDVRVFADVLRRPVVVDAAAGVAAIGEDAGDLGARLESLDAPDFTLSDLAGKPHTFSAIGRKKKLLVTWASW